MFDYKEYDTLGLSVTFKGTETDSEGELTIFVSADKKTVVGKGFINR